MEPEIVRHVGEGFSQAQNWWDWRIALYLFLGGLAAGLMVLTSLRTIFASKERRSDTYRLLVWLAPILLSVGMLALFFDLENKLNVWRFYAALELTAPMSWGAWILVVVYPIAFFYGLGQLSEPQHRKFLSSKVGEFFHGLAHWADGAQVRKVLAWSNLIVGAGLGVYTGILLGSLAARPLWNTAVLGPLFLVSGLSTAAALMMFFKLDEEERHRLVRIDIALLALEITIIGLLLFGLMTGTAVEQTAGHLLLGGPFTAAFWALVIIAGILTPLIAEVFELFGKQGSPWLISSLILLGGFALRWILVYAGQASTI